MLRTHVARPFIVMDDDDDRYLPEGPRLMQLDGRPALVWVNIQTSATAKRGAIHVRFDDGEQWSLMQPDRPGFLVPTTRADHVIVGMGKSVGLLDLSTNHFEPWATIPDHHPRTMINDGEATPDGRAIVFGTKDFQFQDTIAHLYLFTLADRRVTTLASGQLCSNGKFFQERGGQLWLYDIDTPTRSVVRYRLDIEQRALSEPSVAIDTSAEPGFPDGMVATADGSAIIAFYNPNPVAAGRAVCFDLATGKPTEEWTTPGSPRVTCPLLRQVGERGELILTTAVEGMPDEQRPLCPEAGNLFIAETNRLPAPVGVATWE